MKRIRRLMVSLDREGSDALSLLRRMLAISSVAGVILISTSAPSAASASAGNPQKPSDPRNAPTLQEQTQGWTAAQQSTYSAKVKLAKQVALGQSSGTIGYSCVQPCIPASHYSHMSVIYEGSNDCACGPATAAEMYTTYAYYYGQGSGQTLGAVETEMSSKGWYSCSVGTYRYGLADEMNLHQTADYYVWGAVNSGTDVFADTSVDIGGYNFAVGYDGETYSSRNGYPLDNYQGVNWQHYFPAYGYDQYKNVYVADPHFAYDHQYTSNAVYLFIDNFPFTNQVLW